MGTEDQEAVQKDEASKKADTEYEAGWGEEGEGEGADGKGDLKEGTEDAGLSVEEEGEKTSKQTSQTKEPDKGKEDAAQQGPVLKALKDTKAWATRLTEENKILKEKIDAYANGKATVGEVDAQKKAVQDSKDAFEGAKAKAYEDYPELRGVLDPLIDTVNVLKQENAELKKGKEEETQRTARDKVVEAFQRDIKPEVLKRHPDFDAVMKDENYWLWAEAQRPALKVAAMNSSDPEDISWAVSAFKKFMASGEVDALKEQDAQKRKLRITNAMSMKGGHTGIPTGAKRGSEDDYEAGWEMGGKRAAG